MKKFIFTLAILPGYCVCMTLGLFGFGELAGNMAAGFYTWASGDKRKKYTGVTKDE